MLELRFFCVNNGNDTRREDTRQSGAGRERAQPRYFWHPGISFWNRGRGRDIVEGLGSWFLIYKVRESTLTLNPKLRPSLFLSLSFVFAFRGSARRLHGK